jgi:hypothetical protein
MSFELFLDAISDAPGVSRDELRHCFGVRPIEEKPDSWRVEYETPMNHFYLFLESDDSDSERIISLGIWRPIMEVKFWEGLIQVMRSGGLFVYFAGNCPPLVVEETHVERVPKPYVEALGQPICVANWQEILERIRTS